MKQNNYFIKGILGVAIAFSLYSCTKQSPETNSAVNPSDSIGVRLPIAYVNTDSLLNNYQYFIDQNDVLLKKMEAKRLDLGKRQQKWQSEVKAHMEKAQMNAYYSRERMEQEDTRLQRVQQELEQSAGLAQQELATEEAQLYVNLQDSLQTGIRDFNKGKYQVIFSNANSSTFFYMDESYDITKEVTVYLNNRYKGVK